MADPVYDVHELLPGVEGNEDLYGDEPDGESDTDISKEKDGPTERLEILVQRAAEQALNWRTEDLDDDQQRATDYYMGRPFGTEVAGRSKVVSTDVRDTIQGMLPSLMRIFFGPEDVVQYEARGPEDEALSEQLTDMANFVVRCDNDGFLEIHGAMKDAMVRRQGVIKAWWEDEDFTEGYEYTGLTEQDLEQLGAEEGVEVEIKEGYQEPFEGSPTGFVDLFDAYVTRTEKDGDGKIRFETVPPEEYLFSPDARSTQSAEYVGHVREVPAAELVAMGLDNEMVEPHRGKVPVTRTTGDELRQSRRFDENEDQTNPDETDESREGVWFGEHYVYADMSDDEDGHAALIKVRTLGDSYEVYDWEYCHHRPFAVFVCDPEPHTLIGPSIADFVMDVQLIKSHVLRGMLDSLSLSLNPRTVVVETEVEIPDVMNHEVGGVIRVDRDVNAVKEFVHRFDTSGAAAFPVLEYMDEQKENRTGQSKAAAGLDADALQSSTKAAVAATLSASQQRIEMLARVFAETGMSQLFKLILELLVQHQDRSRMIRLRGEWVEMDPASWHSEFDVRVNVALGAGGTEERLKLLGLITEHQKRLLDEGSPLVDRPRYRKGLARMVELAGLPNADEFYSPWTQKEEQEYEQMLAQKPQQPSPDMALIQMQREVEMAKLQLKREEMMMDDARERAKMQLEFAHKQANMEAQYGAKVNDAEIRADVEAAKAVISAAGTEAVARQAPPPAGGQIGGAPPAGGQ